MRIGKDVKTHRQAVINTVILIAIFALFLYLGIQFSRNFSASVSTQRTQTFTDHDYIYLKGYVFRDESLLTVNAPGVCDYLFEDGARVGVGQPFATVYPMPSATEKELQTKQTEINEVSERLRRLRSGISDIGTLSALVGVNKTLSTTYYSYIDAVLDGDFSAAERQSDSLLGALVDYTVITGRDGVAENIADALEQEKQTLLSDIGSSGQTLVRDDAFYLYHETDGYENIFSTAKLDGLSPESLRQLIEKDPEAYDPHVIGKLIHSPEWFLALPVTEATALKFSVGDQYEITFSGGKGSAVNMKLLEVRLDESGDGYLLFSCYDLALSSQLFRAEDVRILMNAQTGYRIPSEALTSQNGEDGVYILVGTVVEFRRVTVLREGNGYYIVNTVEQDSAEGVVSDVPYLNENDLIITSGNDLYDGKLLD